jgi:hypothetical protein
MLPEMEVRLDDLGVSTKTDGEGYFSFGFGDVSMSIPGGHHKLVVNPKLADSRYGTILSTIATEEGRLTQLGIVRTPYLSPARPFEHVTSGQTVTLAQGGFVVNLENATVLFPDGRPDGDVYVQPLFGLDVAYRSIPLANAILTYSVQPMGVEVIGPATVDFALPANEASLPGYVDALPPKVLLTGLDPSAMQIVPVGVGTVNRTTRRVVSDRIELKRLDFIGIVPLNTTAYQTMLSDYATGKIGLQELVGRLMAR